jgi:hypothetical protein
LFQQLITALGEHEVTVELRRGGDFLVECSAGVYGRGFAAMHQKGKKKARRSAQLYWHLGVFLK